ncbi:MAG: VWA domain-containing protein [Paludibaculum sp.]
MYSRSRSRHNLHRPVHRYSESNVDLVQVDAVVTDSRGRHVTDLRPEEFEIRQDGRRQKITHVSFVAGSPIVPPAKKATAGSPGRNLPPLATLGAQDIQRTYALVVDDLGLSFESTARVRSALRRFVEEEMQPNDLAAVLTTGRGAAAFQQFTSDKRILYAAIERLRGNLNSRSGGSISAGGFTPIVDEHDKEWARRHFTSGTLGAVQYIVGGLRGLPGRKSVILFSQNLPMDRFESPQLTEHLRHLADAANRSGVVIYTVDVRPLSSPEGFSAESRRAPIVASEDVVDRINRNQRLKAALLDTQAGLYFLARETGGLFLKDDNDLAKLARQSIEDQSGYYLIGYQPEPGTFEQVRGAPVFHRVNVKALRPGTQVRTRSGFLGAQDLPESSVPKTRGGSIAAAFASPFHATEIPVRLTSWFDDEPEGGPSILSMVHIDAKGLYFTEEADGWRKAVVDVITVAVGEAGPSVNRLDRTYTVRARGPVYESLLKEGLMYTTTHPLKVLGPFQYRVVVRDANTGRLGSANQFIEVPALQKGRLAVSGVVLLNATNEAVQKLGAGGGGDDALTEQTGGHPALRRFRYGQKVAYSYRILNASERVETELRLYRDGTLVFHTPPKEVAAQAGSPGYRQMTGVLTLGPPLLTGDYVLQAVVTDKTGKRKQNVATGAMDFELLLAPNLE